MIGELAPRPVWRTRSVVRRWEIILGLAVFLCAGCVADRPSTDRPLRWSFSSRWSVGGQADKGVAVSQLEPFQIASGAANTVYLLDRPLHGILELGPDGVIRDTLGRQGEGPGELSDPWALAVDSSGTLGAIDMGKRAIVRWSAGRTLLPATEVRGFVYNPKFAFQGDAITLNLRGEDPRGHPEYQLTRITPAGLTVLARLQEAPRRKADLPSCHASDISLAPLFAPVIKWDAAGNRVAASTGPEYEVHLFSGGIATGVASRRIAAPRASQVLAEREAAEWRFNGCLVPPAEVARAAGFLDVIPVIKDVVLSPDGLLWVRRIGAAATEFRIDVFDSTGSYIGTLPSGSPFPAAFLGSNGILALEKDSDDVPHVTLYELNRGVGILGRP